MKSLTPLILTFQSRHLLEEENKITTVIHLLSLRILIATDQTTHKIHQELKNSFPRKLIRTFRSAPTTENPSKFCKNQIGENWYRDLRVTTHTLREIKHNLSLDRI